MEISRSKRDKLSLLIFALVFALVMGTIVSRLPFQAADFNSFDAINYALALSKFDMRLHQPQPPGYILYILIGRAFNLLLHDPRLALLWLSAVSSGLAVLVIFLFAWEMFGRRVGLLAACILATSPLFWFEGEILAPYTTDLLFSVLLGWLCYLTNKGYRKNIVWICALILGLAGAFRLQTMVFFFPLFIFSVWRRPLKIILFSTALALITFSAFFIPSIIVSGGFKEFIRLMTGILPLFASTSNLVRSTRLIHFQYNAEVLVKSTFTTVGELAWPFIMLGILALWKREISLRKERIVFLGLMVLPIWIIYFLIWAGNQGTFLVSLPPFVVLAALGLDWLFSRSHWKTVGWIGLVGLFAGQTVVFTLLPERPFGDAYRQFDNRQTLVRLVDYYQNKLALIREFPPEGTVVCAREFRHLQYYLPQYLVIAEPRFDRENPKMVVTSFIKNGKINYTDNIDVSDLIPPGTKIIILFDLPPEKYLVDPSVAEEIKRNGFSIFVIRIQEGKSFIWTTKGIAIPP